MASGLEVSSKRNGLVTTQTMRERWHTASTSTGKGMTFSNLFCEGALHVLAVATEVHLLFKEYDTGQAENLMRF